MVRSYGTAMLDRDRGMCPLYFILFLCGLPCRLPLRGAPNMTGFMGGVDDAEGFSGAGSLESFQFFLEG